MAHATSMPGDFGMTTPHITLDQFSEPDFADVALQVGARKSTLTFTLTDEGLEKIRRWVKQSQAYRRFFR